MASTTANSVCVNPAAEPYDGDVVLVCLDNQVMVKRIFFAPQAPSLRSASDRYPVKYFSRYDVDNGYYVYYGKVTMALTPDRPQKLNPNTAGAQPPLQQGLSPLWKNHVTFALLTLMIFAWLVFLRSSWPFL